jgi:hypothetical protein
VLELAASLALALTVGAALGLRRRRARRAGLGVSVLDPMPAGVKHLATTVSDLSDIGLHLPSSRAALTSKARLGALLHLSN